MVGVPGRSKGCNTCRKRKVRCSLERPNCSECLKSARKCLGYDRPVIFVNNVKQYTIKPNLDSQQEGRKNCITTPIHDDTAIEKMRRTKAFQTFYADAFTTDSLYNVSMQQQILATFYDQARKNIGPLGGKMSWTGIIPYIARPNKPLQYAALALATARLGRDLSDQHVSRQSLKLYVNSLTQLQKALRNENNLYSDETLGACMLLTMYEIMECPSEGRSGYLNHQNGCARLIQVRGPDAHQEGLGHAIFLHFRYMAALEAMVTKSTFFNGSEWKEVPFLVETKSNLDVFLDLFLEGLSLMKDGDIISTMSPDLQLSRGVGLLRRCWQYDLKMKEFYKNMKATEVSPMFWTFMCFDETDRDGHPDSLADFVFEFTDIRIANTLMLYWAALTLLWAGMSHLYCMIDELRKQFAPDTGKHEIYDRLGIPEPAYSGDFIITARKVLQSVAFCTRDELSKSVTVAPLNIIIDALRPWNQYDKEIAWAESKLKEVERSGMRIIKYLTATEYKNEASMTA